MAVDLPPPVPLVQIEQLAPARAPASTPAQNLRARSQREAALSLGAQAGLAWRGAQIRAVLEGQASQLDQIYDFKRLLHGGHALPPVITESRNGFRVEGPDAARSQRISWTIVAPAKLVSLAPSWRDYLMRQDPAVDLDQVPDLLRPATDAERAAWREAVREGWRQGVAQMDAIFQAQVAQLTRDLSACCALNCWWPRASSALRAMPKVASVSLKKARPCMSMIVCCASLRRRRSSPEPSNGRHGYGDFC